MSQSTHPARSLDFLSRLHDGELTAAERAHFESHRAHCGECRKASADFEQALSSFRRAGSPPPPRDLAARILRRLEATNRRRSPFGVSFGIDLRWAGAFAAALIAVVLGYALVERQARPRRIAVFFATPAPAPADERAVKPAVLPPIETEPRATSPPAAQPPASKTEAKRAPAPPEASRERAAPASVPADRLEARPTPAAVAAQPASTSQKESLDTARVPANGASFARAQGVVAAATPATNRVDVSALDGEEAPPAILDSPRLALTSEDCGQYVFWVGADGVPIEVSPANRDKKKDAAVQKAPIEKLKQMRFQPGSRPRRLLVKIESP
jgi:hypothetical protein